jgi:hypothetical protein
MNVKRVIGWSFSLHPFCLMPNTEGYIGGAKHNNLPDIIEETFFYDFSRAYCTSRCTIGRNQNSVKFFLGFQFYNRQRRSVKQSLWFCLVSLVSSYNLPRLQCLFVTISNCIDNIVGMNLKIINSVEPEKCKHLIILTNSFAYKLNSFQLLLHNEMPLTRLSFINTNIILYVSSSMVLL